MLLSGLLAGIVYRRAIQRQGPAAGLPKVLMRAATLYTWMPRARLLRDALASRGIPLEWQELPGAHDVDYWNGHIVEYVQFYGAALKAE